MSTNRIVIIYNASGTLYGELSYIAKKLLHISSCAACEITHSLSEFGEKKEFKDCRSRLKYEVDLLHDDELLTDVRNFVSSEGLMLPLVLLKSTDGITLLFDSIDLDNMKGSVQLFESELNKKL